MGEKNNNALEFDDILHKYIGDFGLFQILLLICTCSTSINYAFNTIDYTFTAAIPEFWCDVGDYNVSHLEDGGLSSENLTKLFSPQVTSSGETTYDQCNVYNRSYTRLDVDEAWGIIRHENISGSTVPCRKWIYSQEQFTSTIVSQWDLVCDREWMIATSQVVFMAGKFTIILGGWMADKFGRKPFSLAMMILHMVSRTAAALSYNYYMFIVARFFMSVSAANWYTTVIVLCIEMVGPKWRVLAGQGPFFCWSIGYMICAPMGYFIRDWRILTLAFLIFAIPYLIHFCLLPESVRWLNTNDKPKQARNIIKRMAKVNRRELPEVWSLNIMTEAKSNSTYLDLFKSKYLMKITLILCFLWFVASFTYYGLIYYLPKLGGDIYVSTFISGALEIPALLYVQFALDTRLGRRLNALGTFVLSGSCLLLIILIPKGTWWTLIAALAGRFAITAAYAVVYLYSSEIFPTLLRGTGLAFCINISGFGGLLAPYFVQLDKVAFWLPPLILGVLAVCAGFLSLLLPETSKTRLMDTIAQVNEKNKNDAEKNAGLELNSKGDVTYSNGDLGKDKLLDNKLEQQRTSSDA